MTLLEEARSMIWENKGNDLPCLERADGHNRSDGRVR